MAASLFDPTTRQLHALREALCAEPDVAEPSTWQLSDDDVDHLIDALHNIDNSAGYLAYWCQMDGAESSALTTIRQTVAGLLDAFGA